jgi:hypothetical protein
VWIHRWGQVTGIVAPETEWTEGLASESFTSNLGELKNGCSLDLGLSLSDRAFDRIDGKLVLSEKDCGLAFFVFRLLQRLQALGTVPAIDWNKYASILGNADV